MIDAFTLCDNVLTNKCSGEAAALIRAAQRYGLLTEKAGARIEEICARCQNFSCRGKRSMREPARPAA